MRKFFGTLLGKKRPEFFDVIKGRKSVKYFDPNVKIKREEIIPLILSTPNKYTNTFLNIIFLLIKYFIYL